MHRSITGCDKDDAGVRTINPAAEEKTHGVPKRVPWTEAGHMCPYCSKQFIYRRALINHYNHNGLGGPNDRCNEMTMRQMARQVSEEEDEDRQELLEKQGGVLSLCQFCCKTFSSRAIREWHQLIRRCWRGCGKQPSSPQELRSDARLEGGGLSSTRQQRPPQ